MAKSFKVTSGQIAVYDDEGVVLLKNAIEETWQEQLREAIDDELTRKEKYFSYRHIWRHNPVFRRMCFESPAPRIAADIM